MKKNKLKFLALLGAASICTNLASCIIIIEKLTFRVVTSAGAMMTPFAHWYQDYDNLKTVYYLYDNEKGNAKYTTTEEAFYDEDSPEIIVYDVYDGLLKIINEGLPYKLARVIDNGNLFLMKTKYRAMKEKENPTLETSGMENAKIAYYTDHEDDTSLRKLIQNVYNYHYDLVQVENVNVAYDILLSDNGNSSMSTSRLKYDFVFIENPYAYRATKQDENVTFYNIGVYSSVNNGYDLINSDIKRQIQLKGLGDNKLLGFPDKGLFIKNTLEGDKSVDKMKNFFIAFDQKSSDFMTANSNAVSVMYMLGNDEAQLRRLGTTGQEMSEVQAGITNEVNGQIQYNTIGFMSPDSSTFNSTYMDLDTAIFDCYGDDLVSPTTEDLIYSRYYAYPEEE